MIDARFRTGAMLLHYLACCRHYYCSVLLLSVALGNESCTEKVMRLQLLSLLLARTERCTKYSVLCTSTRFLHFREAKADGSLAYFVRLLYWAWTSLQLQHYWLYGRKLPLALPFLPVAVRRKGQGKSGLLKDCGSLPRCPAWLEACQIDSCADFYWCRSGTIGTIAVP